LISITKLTVPPSGHSTGIMPEKLFHHAKMRALLRLQMSKLQIYNVLKYSCQYHIILPCTEEEANSSSAGTNAVG